MFKNLCRDIKTIQMKDTLLVPSAEVTNHLLLTFLAEDVVAYINRILMLETQRREQDKNLANNYLGPDYIVTQAG